MNIANNQSISVVIPAYNEEKNISQTLQALLKQKVKAQEIIVVDNHSSDNTQKIAKSFIKKFSRKKIKLRILSEPKIGVAFARNKGFYSATSPIIASTDADTIPHSDWIEKIQKHFQRYDSVAVTGISIMTDSTPIIRLISQMNYYKYLTFLLRLIFGFQTINTANAAIKKSAFVSIKGFNSGFISANQLDDTELSSRLSKIGPIRVDTSIRIDGSFRRYQPFHRALSSSFIRLKNFALIAKNRP